MNNPLEILRTLDRHLRKAAELTLFGRSALLLGYSNPPADYGATHDVDGIIPLTLREPDADFWAAQQATNAELKNRGLYITHLFSELDVLLRPEWLAQRVLLELPMAKRNVFRPATIDLVLTKMARGDEQDLADIQFLLKRERLSPGQLRSAFTSARVPPVPEIRDLFAAAQPKVMKLADGSQGKE